MSPHPPIKQLIQALASFPTDNVRLAQELLEIVDEFSPFAVDGFRGEQTKYFDDRVRKYCRRIWTRNWPASTRDSNE